MTLTAAYYAEVVSCVNHMWRCPLDQKVLQQAYYIGLPQLFVVDTGTRAGMSGASTSSSMEQDYQR